MSGALEVRGACWAPKGYRKRLLHDVSFRIGPGEVLGIAGPNGAGKTTLLRLLYRFQRPTSGAVLIDGDDLWRMPARSVACRVAAVLQEQPTDFSLTVREIVALGRTPHQTGFGESAHDAQVVERVIEQLALGLFCQRRFSTLSGGERQRVMVARALAQEPEILILDEPKNHLDIRHQLEVLALIRDLPMTIVTSLHDLNAAAGLCDQVLLLQGGRQIGFGPPEQVLTEATLSQTFHVLAQRELLTPSNAKYLTFHLPNQQAHQ